MQQVFVKEVKQEAIRNGQIPIVSEFMHDELAQNTQRDNERRIVFLWDASDGSGDDARRPMQSRKFWQKRASSNMVRANEAKANLVERQNVGVQVQLGISIRVDDGTKVVGDSNNMRERVNTHGKLKILNLRNDDEVHINDKHTTWTVFLVPPEVERVN